ncbi:pantetheine-phosphate adenylyltransferase [Sulfidibacter corallicola]|uniref:Phosphopantetheine adenylyltransferase n=1 Tax=Sulfidibacter corallicola TaxID=2818388 RepID=A0A8A4TUF3_SULCO|nr:pantetheine-phosphate adenylyltransferase [Sulfidibacter corallicola]QTD52662.1 pantetheine-phosphate adenylyltransferase [Sulfidibacter corallicola]
MALAIFPGSFDPITNGHIDIIERAQKMFDRVIVAVLMNSAKKNPLFTIEERLTLIRRCIDSDRVEVASFEGLLVDFAEKRKASVIVRGLRAVSDFEYELQMAMMNRQLNDEIETVFLMPKTVYSYLSSRMVKEVARLGGDIGTLVPPLIDEALKKKFKGEPVLGSEDR